MSEMLMEFDQVEEPVEEKKSKKKKRKKKEKAPENLPVLLRFQFQLSMFIVVIAPIIVISIGLSSGARLLRTLLIAAGVELVVGLALWLVSFVIARDFINSSIQEKIDEANKVGDEEAAFETGQMDLTEVDQHEMNVEA